MKALTAMTALGLVLAASGALAQTTTDPALAPGGPVVVTDPNTGGTPTTGSTPTTGGAQTAGGTTTISNPNDGAFTRMSPGNQKITEALFSAQTPGGTTGATTGTGTGTSTATTTGTGTQTGSGALGLDDIAARKQDGQGFGTIFKDMKSEGLIDAKNLGQVVSGKAGTSPAPTDTSAAVTTGSGESAGTQSLSTVSPGRKPATVVTLGDGSTVAAATSRGPRGTKVRSNSATTKANATAGTSGGKHSAGITTAGGGAATGAAASGKSHGTHGGGAHTSITTAGGTAAGNHGVSGAKAHGARSGGGHARGGK